MTQNSAYIAGKTIVIKIAALFAFFVLCPLVNVHAKHIALFDDGDDAARFGASSFARTIDMQTSAASAREFERQFRPYLENRVRNKRDRARGIRPSQQHHQTQQHQTQQQHRELQRDFAMMTNADLFLMTQFWDDLSSDFRELYRTATQIAPDEFDATHVSPRGKFIIHYSTEGFHAVDLTDEISIGNGDPSSWRERRAVPNGVPDYVDETAFALDSSWSMLIDRFGFVEPINAPDAYGGTNHYSVIISKLIGGLYGRVWPHERAAPSAPGFSSYMEINGNWSDPGWRQLGYNEHFIGALYITCAHEFTHSSQYAMAWSRGIDAFALGFIEGSAVLMEEIAFPDVNDYLQYLSRYFDNPRRTMLGNSDIYMNGIIMKYIYEFSNPTDSIGFVRAVHFNSFNARNLNFHRNLERAAQDYANRPWAELLNSFHARSYFTNVRARPNMFVSDAELMSRWALPTAANVRRDSINTASNSARFFRFTPTGTSSDTLVLFVRGANDPAFAGQTWAARVLIMEDDSTRIERVAMNANGTARVEIENWREKNGALLVVSNGSPTSRNLIVQIVDDSTEIVEPPLPANEQLVIRPNMTHVRSSAPIRILGDNVTDVTVITQEGRVFARYTNRGSPNVGFTKERGPGDRDIIEWHPNERAAPGVYFVTATSHNPRTNRRSTMRRKIMLLP